MVRIGCDGEGWFYYYHFIYVSIAGVGEAGASGKMVSGAVVPGAGWADRGCLARHEK
jgi:hypothetical protein